MSDPNDQASHQEEMTTETAIQCTRPAPEAVECFWKRIERWEADNGITDGKAL